MPNVKPELREQFNSQTAVFAALKAALPSADEADKPEIQSQIAIYESALADPAYQNNYDPSRDPTAVELIIGRVAGFQTPMSAGTLRLSTIQMTFVLTTAQFIGPCQMSQSGRSRMMYSMPMPV